MVGQINPLANRLLREEYVENGMTIEHGTGSTGLTVLIISAASD